jgi:hypothetical protein
VAAVDDLVVSDNLAALLIAQISENPKLAPIFEDLFDAQGASLSVRDIALYAPVGKEVSYAQLVANARTKGESAVGYRSATKSVGDAAAGVSLNPSKEALFTPQKGDSLIVVADTIR